MSEKEPINIDLDFVDDIFKNARIEYETAVDKMEPYIMPFDDEPCGGSATCWITGHQENPQLKSTLLEYCNETGRCKKPRVRDPNALHFYFWYDDRDRRRDCKIFDKKDIVKTKCEMT